MPTKTIHADNLSAASCFSADIRIAMASPKQVSWALKGGDGKFEYKNSFDSGYAFPRHHLPETMNGMWLL